MSDKIHNIIFYSLVFLVGVSTFYWLKTANDATLKILLQPHARITEIYYNIPLVYKNGVGYLSMDGSFSIGRQCMGSSFTLMMFGMISIMFAQYFRGIYKIAWFATSLLTSILIGIAASCIRIVASVPFIAHPKFALFHSTIGVYLYFLTLMLSYAILNKLIRSNGHEKSF